MQDLAKEQHNPPEFAIVLICFLIPKLLLGVCGLVRFHCSCSSTSFFLNESPLKSCCDFFSTDGHIHPHLASSAGGRGGAAPTSLGNVQYVMMQYQKEKLDISDGTNFLKERRNQSCL